MQAIHQHCTETKGESSESPKAGANAAVWHISVTKLRWSHLQSLKDSLASAQAKRALSGSTTR
eukprot:1198821-Rhodomonas_salina.3